MGIGHRAHKITISKYLLRNTGPTGPETVKAAFPDHIANRPMLWAITMVLEDYGEVEVCYYFTMH